MAFNGIISLGAENGIAKSAKTRKHFEPNYRMIIQYYTLFVRVFPKDFIVHYRIVMERGGDTCSKQYKCLFYCMSSSHSQ